MRHLEQILSKIKSLFSACINNNSYTPFDVEWMKLSDDLEIGMVKLGNVRRFKYSEVQNLNLITPEVAELIVKKTRFHLGYNMTGVTTFRLYGIYDQDHLIFDYTGYTGAERGPLFVWVKSEEDAHGNHRVIKTDNKNSKWVEFPITQKRFGGDKSIAFIYK